jgi:hypothetical protein
MGKQGCEAMYIAIAEYLNGSEKNYVWNLCWESWLFQAGDEKAGWYRREVSVQDTTASFAYIDRGSMHVVEHHNDLFSWKKHNN